MVELQSIPVEEGTEPKSIDNIVDEVLGTRSGYIKGIGYGPKPSSNISKANLVDLEESLKRYNMSFNNISQLLKSFKVKFKLWQMP